MTKLLAYHGSQTTKDKYLGRVIGHRKADQIVQGYGYWKDGKGCAIGCSIHGSNHAAYETELGIPEVLARLEDKIFERLPVENARAWPERFLAAIKPGADLSMVWRRWVLWLLSDAEHGTLRLCDPAGAEATKRVIALYQREIDGDKVSLAEWKQAREQAWAARRADAAYAYAYAAYADAADAAYAAYAAAAAAYAAADAAAAAYAAAAAAAAYAARLAHCVRSSEKLLELLAAAEVPA